MITDRSHLVDLDRRYVWPPYTASQVHESADPFVFVRGEGAYLVDADGRRYLDGKSSWWTTSLGHRHPRLVDVVRRQGEELFHCSMAGSTNPHAAQLAEDLVQVAPAGLARVFFSDNGSTAVEVALKAAFQYWRQNGRPDRTVFLSLAGAYHGDTHGSMSVGDLAEFHDLFAPILFEVIRAPDPSEVGGWERVVSEIEARVRAEQDRLCGVVVEPLVQGAGGMRMWSPDLLRRLRAVTREVDTFLIADEVFTGLGRTGAMWACDHAEVAPDFLCVAKALGGGVLPIAATLASERVYDGFRGGLDRALMHGHTFCGHPLGCAIGREVLAVYRDEEVLQGIPERSARLAAALAEIAEVTGVKRCRHLGMVAACDVGEGGYQGETGWRVAEAARELGAYLRPLGDVVYMCPPLNIPLADLDRLCEIFVRAVNRGISPHG